MFDKKYLYEFDPSGGLAANRVPPESHIINPASGADYDVIIPIFAPFFRKGLVVKHLSSGQTLTEGVHFDLGYKFAAASLETQTEIFGCIVMLDRTLSGNLTVEYQTLGGEWVLDAQEILNILANIHNDPRQVKWDDIIDKPIVFPPVDHLHHSDDLVGMDEVVDAIEAIRATIGDSAAKALTALLEHLRDHANPHHVTLSQLGLDSLGQLSEATEQDVDAGTDNLRFISSRRLAYFLTRKVQPVVDAHANRTNNPHSVTATQVGLGNVPNFRMATLAEAMEGVLTDRFMSPSLVQSLVADRIAAALAEGGDKPTKESIGLGNVQNYGIADFEQAVAGTSNALYMTPLRVANHVANAIATAMQAHLDADNPHNITAQTVGLNLVQNYGVATAAELVAGTAPNKYVTVAGVTTMLQNAIGGGVAEDLAAHEADRNNPHAVTKTQVGLGDVDNYKTATAGQVDLTVANLFMTPAAFLGSLWNKLSDRVMESAQIGDVPFVDGNGQTGGVRYGRVVARDVVFSTNAAELAKLKSADEDFSRVFSTWRRFSVVGSNLVSPAVPAEIDAWVYDSVNNKIVCQVNSTSVIGFVSPKSYSDYTFEAQMTSSDADDDLIGVLLGYYQEDGNTHTLTAFRTPGGGTNLWIIAKDFGTTEQKYISNINGGLKWWDGTVNDSRPLVPGEATANGKGWGQWLQGVKIRATRVGDVLTVETTDLNGSVYVPTATVTIDLAADDDLAGFTGSSPVGYVCFSQTLSTWKTLARPDGRQPIYDLSAGHVLEFDGSDWAVGESSDELVHAGQIYHTALTGKTHFVDTFGDVFLIADLNPVTVVTTADSTDINFSGEGNADSPLTATLTGTTANALHSDVDMTAGT